MTDESRTDADGDRDQEPTAEPDPDAEPVEADDADGEDLEGDEQQARERRRAGGESVEPEEDA